MKIYRSFKDCYLADIRDDFEPSSHVYGKGFCYGLDESVQKEYSSDFKKFYYLIEYDFNESLFPKIDASKFDQSDDLLHYCFYFLKYELFNDNYDKEKFEKKAEDLDLPSNLDLSSIKQIFIEKGMNQQDQSNFWMPNCDKYFEEFGYFFIFNNKVIWTKKLEEMFGDSGIVVENYQDAQLVIFNKAIILPERTKIRLAVEFEYADFYELVSDKLKLSLPVQKKAD